MFGDIPSASRTIASSSLEYKVYSLSRSKNNANDCSFRSAVPSDSMRIQIILVEKEFNEEHMHLFCDSKAIGFPKVLIRIVENDSVSGTPSRKASGEMLVVFHRLK